MTDRSRSDDPTDPRRFGDNYWLGDPETLAQLWRILDIPNLEGHSPAAITAVAVAVSKTGEVVRYPLYAQLSPTGLAEAIEVQMAIEILRRWARTQSDFGA